MATYDEISFIPPVEVSGDRIRTETRRVRPGRSHLSPRDLVDLRRRLLSTRRKLAAEISVLQNATCGALEGGADAAMRQWERLISLSTLDRKLWLFHEVNQALSRIKNKTYGYCEETERPISLMRLRDFPWARRC